MFPILLLLFIFVPIVEIGLFIQVGDFLGLWPTVSLVLITAVVGAALVRSQGLQTLMSVQSRLQQGELPAQQIFEGVMLAITGVLLLTPGFMTDAMGMLILLPAPRAAIAKYLMSKMTLHTAANGFNAQFQNDPFKHNPFKQQPFDHQDHQQGSTFEGEFERKDKEDNNRLS